MNPQSSVLLQRFTIELSLVETESPYWVNLPPSSPAAWAEFIFLICLPIPILLIRHTQCLHERDERRTQVCALNFRMFYAIGGLGLYGFVSLVCNSLIPLGFFYGCFTSVNHMALRLHDSPTSMTYQYIQGLIWIVGYFDMRIFAYCLVVQYFILLYKLGKRLIEKKKPGILISILIFLALPWAYFATEGAIQVIATYGTWLLGNLSVVLFPTTQQMLFYFSKIEGAPQ